MTKSLLFANVKDMASDLAKGERMSWKSYVWIWQKLALKRFHIYKLTIKHLNWSPSKIVLRRCIRKTKDGDPLSIILAPHPLQIVWASTDHKIIHIHVYLRNANAGSILNWIIFLRIDYNQSSIHIIIFFSNLTRVPIFVPIEINPSWPDPKKNERKQSTFFIHTYNHLYPIVFIYKYSEYLCSHKKKSSAQSV